MKTMHPPGYHHNGFVATQAHHVQLSWLTVQLSWLTATKPLWL